MPLADLPQSNRQHAVPQNIMDVEFKLIGDLTMRQFSYLAVLGLSAYFAYLLIPGLFKWPTVIVLSLFALSLAFVPVQERGLDEWLVNFFRAINSPTQRVWKKEPQVPTAFMYDNLAVVHQEMITLAPTSSRRKLEEYLRFKTDVEKEDPLDIPEEAYIKKVREVYPDMPNTSQVGISFSEPDIVLDTYNQELSAPEIPLDEKKEERVEDEHIVSTIPEIEKKNEAVNDEEAPQPKPVIRRSKISSAKPSYQSGSDSLKLEYSGYSAITPDMHSGRRFVNLVPSQGQITLPIRGEKVLETSESVEVRNDLEDKAKKLRDLLEKIRVEEGLPLDKSKVTNKILAPPEVDKEAREVVERLKKQNEDLSGEIQNLKQQIEKGKSMFIETSAQEELLRKLESQKGDIASSYSELRSQVQDLQKKLYEKENVSTGDAFIQKMKTQLPVLTNKPNIVTGVVRDSEGKLLSDLLLMIKNSRGDTVRALKTNSMGQFVVSTALQNGTYTVEVSPSNSTNLTFGIIPIEIKGEIIPTLDIIGK